MMAQMIGALGAGLSRRKARQRAVKTGISDTTHVEILDGAEEGEQVVTGPYRALKKLQDGDVVKVTVEKKDGNGTGRAGEEQDEDE